MARIRLTIPRKTDWLPSDRLQVKVGSENAADLASSTPAGGTILRTVPAMPESMTESGWGNGAWGDFEWGDNPNQIFQWGDDETVWGYGDWGFDLVPPAVIEFEYYPDDVCAILPVGVTLVDALGNESDVIETLAQLSDPPEGARNLSIGSTGSPNEVRLTFTSSRHVTS